MPNYLRKPFGPGWALAGLLAAMSGNQDAMDAFARVNAGVTPPSEFFSPANVGRIFAAAQPT